MSSATGAPPPLRALDVVMTAGCNLSCSYCYQDDKQPRVTLPDDALIAAVDRLLASRERRPRLTFFGGEPLLRYSAIRTAVAHAEARAPGRLRYAVQTNGTLLDGERLAFFVAHDTDVHLSMDGVASVQAERGTGTFAVLDERLTAWRRRHRFWFDDHLSVTMTLLPATLDRLAASVEYLIEKGVRRISFNPLVTDSAAWEPDRIGELDRQFAAIDAVCRRVFTETGRVPVDILRHHGSDDRSRPRGISMCGVAGGDTLTVDADGRVFGCATFAESFQTARTPLMRREFEPLRMVDIRSPDLEASRERYRERASRSAVLSGKQRKRSSYGACGECRFLGTCAVCPTSIVMQAGNDDPDRVPDFLCAYNLVALSYRERFPVSGGVSLLASDARRSGALDRLQALAR